MIEVIKNTYDYDQYDNLIVDLTSAWDWDNIETLTDENVTNFYVGNAYIKIASTSTAISISLQFNNAAIFISSGAYTFVKIVKNSTSMVIHFYNNTNIIDNSSYNNGSIVAIGQGTNMVTGEKENIIAHVGHLSINSANSNYNKGIVCSKDVTSNVFNTITFLDYNVNNNIAMTMLKPINSKESQVVMDNVYIADRCTLATPSFGECTLGNKKYFMIYAIWIPYD